MSSEGQNKNLRKKGQRGQLVIEYILLLLLSVVVATQIQRQLIGGTADDVENAGIMSQFVFRTAIAIARDTPGE